MYSTSVSWASSGPRMWSTSGSTGGASTIGRSAVSSPQRFAATRKISQPSAVASTIAINTPTVACRPRSDVEPNARPMTWSGWGGERWDRRAGRAGVGPRWGRGRGTLRLHPRGCAPGPGGGPPSGPARSPAPRPRGRPRAAGRCGRTDHHPSPAHGRRRLHRRACRADHRVSRLPRDDAAAQRPSGRRPLGADLRRRLPARARLRGRPSRRAGPAAQVLRRARPAAEDQRAVLVETLRQWLLQWGHRPGIAQALTVHPQTMSGRLHQLRDLLADDLEDAVVRAELLVLLTAEGPPDRRSLLCSPCQESDHPGDLPGPGCEPVSSRRRAGCGCSSTRCAAR